MRLIDTTTLILTEFFGANIPTYAILSHTWGPDEVSFQDFQNLGTARLKAGFAKIEGTCIQALKDELGWCWVDTCCIDKTSSAELSEAINSMYAWYQNAKVCYAYLADIPNQVRIGETFIDNPHTRFHASKWFTRGWTLQELLAPRVLLFFTREWMPFGTKIELGNDLANITGIGVSFLKGLQTIHEASIAKKMSWIAKRETTRVEDLAYCLLGIFEVNMPLLYGEGQGAFVRLQEEILKLSNDQSIFCWEWDRKEVEESWRSILAPCPSVFKYSGNFAPSAQLAIDNAEPIRAYHITNAGLSIWLPIIGYHHHDFMFAVLKVTHNKVDRVGISGMSVCIPLNKSRIHRRIPQPSNPFQLPLRIAEPPRNIFIECRQTGLSARQRHGPLYGRAQDLLTNENNFGFVFVEIGSQGKWQFPPLCYSSPNADFNSSRNLLTFSFPSNLETSGIAIFRKNVGSDDDDDDDFFFWLAITSDLPETGRRQYKSYAGTLASLNSIRASVEVIWESVNRLSESQKDRQSVTIRVKTGPDTILLGRRIVYSGARKGRKNAQIVYLGSEAQLKALPWGVVPL